MYSLDQSYVVALLKCLEHAPLTLKMAITDTDYYSIRRSCRISKKA